MSLSLYASAPIPRSSFFWTLYDGPWPSGYLNNGRDSQRHPSRRSLEDKSRSPQFMSNRRLVRSAPQNRRACEAMTIGLRAARRRAANLALQCPQPLRRDEQRRGAEKADHARSLLGYNERLSSLRDQSNAPLRVCLWARVHTASRCFGDNRFAGACFPSAQRAWVRKFSGAANHWSVRQAVMLTRTTDPQSRFNLHSWCKCEIRVNNKQSAS